MFFCFTIFYVQSSTGQRSPQGLKVKGLAYFDDPVNLNLLNAGNPPNPPYYFDNDIMAFTPPWPGGPVSYAQAMAPTSLGGWILAGQADDGPEVMTAMVVEPVNGSFTDFTVSHFTEALGGDGSGNNCYANYVIELTPGNGKRKRYALFGKANWAANDSDGNTYVVIVEEF